MAKKSSASAPRIRCPGARVCSSLAGEKRRNYSDARERRL